MSRKSEKTPEHGYKGQLKPLPGFPFQGTLKTLEEVRAYFDAEKLTCLLCGRERVGLGVHIVQGHRMTLDEYKERFNIPWTYGLAGTGFKKQQSKRMKRTIKALLFDCV